MSDAAVNHCAFSARTPKRPALTSPPDIRLRELVDRPIEHIDVLGLAQMVVSDQAGAVAGSLQQSFGQSFVEWGGQRKALVLGRYDGSSISAGGDHGMSISLDPQRNHATCVFTASHSGRAGLAVKEMVVGSSPTAGARHPI